MTRVIMHGCNGKMGQMIAGLIAQDEEVKLVAGVDVYDQGRNPIPVYKHISDCDVQADVIIDFCNPAAIKGLMEYCVERQIPCVVCTTGLSEEELNYVREASKKVAILRSANMSLGINTLMELLKKAAQVFAPAGFDMEIVEKHHNQKLDAPSGTSKELGEIIAGVRGEKLANVADYGRKGRGLREKDHIGYHSVRAGDISSTHTLIFGMEGERIEITHRSYDCLLYTSDAADD